VAQPPPAPAVDPRSDAARIRSELHRLVALLAARRYEEAAALLAPSELEWTASTLEAALADYWAEHTKILTTPLSRQPRNTVLTPLGPRRFAVQQKLIDPEEDEDWHLECEVDLASAPPDGPLLALRAIGR
jgi:hypothetical protein